MEWYLIGGFFIWCAIVYVIMSKVDSPKWSDGNITSAEKHQKETTATSALDVASNPPGFDDVASSNAVSDMGSIDSSGSDSGGSESGGGDSGGYAVFTRIRLKNKNQPLNSQIYSANRSTKPSVSFFICRMDFPKCRRYDCSMTGTDLARIGHLSTFMDNPQSRDLSLRNFRFPLLA